MLSHTKVHQTLQNKAEEKISLTKHKPKAKNSCLTHINNYKSLYFWSSILIPLIVHPHVNNLALIMMPELFACNVGPEPTFIHGEPVTELTNDTSCKFKWIGITTGKSCDISNQKYFLKLLPCPSDNSNGGYYSYEAYNQEFCANIGVRVPPKIRFFKDKDIRTYYIGSEKIEDLTLGYYEEAQIKLTKTEIAQLIVSATFFKDLAKNTGNWGRDKKGLILIDVDSTLKITKTTKEFMHIAMTTMKEFKVRRLSLDVLKEMREIYIKMQDKTLPRFHEKCEQHPDTYLEVLTIYIDCCNKTIDKVQRLKSSMDLRGINIQDILYNELRGIYDTIQNPTSKRSMLSV